MSSSLENKQFSIKITNFINPHLFFFKLDNIIVGQSDIDVEKKLDEYTKEARWSHPTGYHPQEHEIVSAYIMEWRKWVRAAVDVIFDLDAAACKQYIIWCLDHGVSIKLGAQYILPMPANLQRLPASVYRGGLAKCVPIEKRFSYAKSEYEVTNADRFNDFLTTYAKQLLEEASEIIFKPLQKMDDDHIFGDIQIVKHTGHTVDMLRALKKRDCVSISENDIPFGIENWETTKTPRYKTDHGQLNVRQVKIRPLRNPDSHLKRNKKHHGSAISVCSADLDEDSKMVLDWSRQNTVLARDMERIIKNQFETVIEDLDQYMMAPRQRREPHHMFHNAISLTSVNQSNSNLSSLYGSRSTIADVQSVGGESGVPSMISARISSRFREALKQTSKTAPKNEQKTVFIPAGFERDVLEFHKYNEF